MVDFESGLDAPALTAADLNHWSPELRRALIAVQPGYFSWPPDQQLRYRVKQPLADRQALVAGLLRAHGNRRPVATAKLESRGRIPLELQHQVNQWLQPLAGIGEDHFNLNRIFGEGRSILDFPTLLAYDEDDHAFQEDVRQREDPRYIRRPYAGGLHALWARCLIDGRLCYLTLSMAAWHLYGAMQTAVSEEIERLVPHRYVAGQDDGKVDGGLIRWDRRVDAGGQEALLEELQHRVWDYEVRRCEELLGEFMGQGRAATWFIEDPFPEAGKARDESNLLIVFSDPAALARVRFARFMRDCRAMQQSGDELKARGDREVQAILNFARLQHDDLRRNFDPKVMPLRKRYKVMLHPEALRDLGDDTAS